MLKVEKLSCGYKDNVVLKDVSFTAKPKDIVCILGPNGAGKSTLIKTLLGLLEPYSGDVFIHNENIKDWNWRERARYISYIPQSFNSTFQYKSIDIVLMGRTSHIKFSSSPSEEDEKIAEEAMKNLNILHLKDKIYSQLSGGERQLVKIAQALAQQSKIIIMDEPTNNLDFSNQMVMLSYLRKCVDMGITIIMATHSPEHVFLYGTKALLIKDSSVIEIDNPSKNLKEEHLKSIYNIDLKIVELELNESTYKMCLPIF